MFCALMNSATGAPQLAATDYSFNNVWLWDVGTGSPCGKFKATGEWGRTLVRDPFNPATVVLVSNGKAEVIDTRAKAISRRLVTVGSGDSFSFPPTSGGKLVCIADGSTHKRQYAVVVDFGTGKVMHKIKTPDDGESYAINSVAMAGNCIAASLYSMGSTGFYFWDISTHVLLRPVWRKVLTRVFRRRRRQGGDQRADALSQVCPPFRSARHVAALPLRFQHLLRRPLLQECALSAVLRASVSLASKSAAISVKAYTFTFLVECCGARSPIRRCPTQAGLAVARDTGLTG